MSITASSLKRSRVKKSLDLARVLLVHGELAPRLTLQTILQASGYTVEVASTPEEALFKLDEGQYDLVLSDAEFGERSAGRDVLAYARVKNYRPATALITSYEPLKIQPGRTQSRISIYTENIPHLLSAVADLIGARASRRYRPLRHAV